MSRLLQMQLKRFLKEMKYVRRYTMSDTAVPSHIMGAEHLDNPRLNKGLAFSLKERQSLGIHGLQPPKIRTQDDQVEMIKAAMKRFKNNLNKYAYLYDLLSRNEKLFYRFLSENVKLIMPIIYTPTVGLACQKYNLLYTRPYGMIVTIKDKGHCLDVIKNWPEHDVKIVVVTDGERILGLGDLGVCGCGIPIGKSVLYTALGGIKPYYCMPVTLDCGTNNEEFLKDNLYLGLSMKRVRGDEYYEFVDEFIRALVSRFGQHVMIQFEDFATPNAFYFLEKYRHKYCVFNDDIQGTAGVVVAGLLASKRITGRSISENLILFFGAGGAALGIASLCVMAMVREGLSLEEARTRIWLFDLHGLLVKSRPDKAPKFAEDFVKDHKETADLMEVIREIKPTALIGVSATGGAFTPEILKEMAKINERPIVFALSNPTSLSECSAEDAYIHTDGRVIFASGSPFDEFVYKGKTYETGQCNNSYIFPGIVLGVLSGQMYHVKEEYFLIAAQVVADNVPEENLEKGSLYPDLNETVTISRKIATALIICGYKHGFCTVYPEPENKKAFIMKQLYNFSYTDAQPSVYEWENEEEYHNVEKIMAKDVPHVET